MLRFKQVVRSNCSSTTVKKRLAGLLQSFIYALDNFATLWGIQHHPLADFVTKAITTTADGIAIGGGADTDTWVSMHSFYWLVQHCSVA